jgi:hypothetical protein
MCGEPRESARSTGVEDRRILGLHEAVGLVGRASLLDHLIRPQQDRLRDRQA